jgi:hypothetical protein
MSTNQYKVVPIDSIVPYENNPRDNDAAVEGIANSIASFGFNVPISVDEDMVVLGGHTRLKAARLLGLGECPVYVIHGLSEAQKTAYRLADNRLAENSKWNEAALSEELRLLQEMGFDLSQTGFAQDEVDCLLDTVTADCLDDLTVENVCGDLEEVHSVPINTIRVSIGAFRYMVPKEKYDIWAASMLEKYKTVEKVQEAISKKLGLAND